MAITDCTDNPYSYEFPWTASGDTVTPPYPVFTDGDNPNNGAQQCQSVALGGFIGLNN
jgi:hypothetical protein